MAARNLLLLFLAIALATACEKSDKSEPPATAQTEVSHAEQGHGVGLENATAMIENAKLCEPQDGVGSVAACQRACELNHSNSCANWGRFLEETDAEEAAKLYKRSCVGGSGIGCEAEAQASKRAGKPEADAQFRNARNYHRVHCSQGYARSCSQLAALHSQGLGGAANAQTARSFRERACLLGRSADC